MPQITVKGLSFPPLNNTARLEAINRLQKAFQPIRDLTPDSGAYINEVSAAVTSTYLSWTSKPPELTVTGPRL